MSFDALLATADRAVLQTLGCAVGYTSSAGEARSVRGVFDAAYVKVDAGQPGVSTCGPAVFLSLTDLPSDAADDDPAISIAGVAYRVREAKPDGLGGILFLLHKA